MSVCIRAVRTEDWPTLRKIFLEARRAMFTQIASDSFQLMDLDQQAYGESIFVADDGKGTVLGFISIQENDRYIHHLYVDASVQGSGIGRILLYRLPAWGSSRYSLKCLSVNTRAAAFYVACGFLAANIGVAADGEFILFQIATGIRQEPIAS